VLQFVNTVVGGDEGEDVHEPMTLLVIDTSTDEPAVGVLPQTGPPAVAPAGSSRRHGRDLVPTIRDLLGVLGLSTLELSVVAVGLGPGSYTGLRIGLTAAKTLAYVTGADLVGFDSLEGWAHTAPPEASRVYVVADAQRGDVYAADLARSSPREPLALVAASQIEPLGIWSSRLAEPGVVLGPGIDSPSIRSAIPPAFSIVHPAPDRPRAFALLDLARELWQGGRRDNLWTIEPNYLRRSAAEDLWDTRARRP
jgi:tRNA threonylcarbamoyladenosine biosynthesis protein TsaB